MKLVFEIKDEYISSLKYILFAVAIILGISYVYFIVGGEIESPTDKFYLLLASIFGIYMAANLGANDVANNMGPAVGSKVLTLGGAILIAAFFEASGAILAGGDVVGTIKSGIINQELITDNVVSITIMLATLLGAAIWINVATYVKAPVSATHAIIGGLLGAGMTAQITSIGGSVFSFTESIVFWDKVGMIAIAWVVAIFMGGFISIAIFKSIKTNILDKEEKGEAAKHWVPIYVGLMSTIFAIYLLLKGFKPLLKTSESLSDLITPASATITGVIIGILVYTILVISYKKHEAGFFKDKNKFINKLFNIPLIFAVALLSFAHGSNDVANAIGPVASIYDTITSGTLTSKVNIPTWIMILGALSLSAGLAVFGGRLIKTVGSEITKLNQIRAFCVALSAAITVIIASKMGLPVSSTQIAIGAIFGIGLFREYEKRIIGKERDYINKGEIKKIVLSWIVTLPISGLIASMTYLIIINLS